MSKTMTRAARLHTYRVLYAVTRSEAYEIEASSREDAQERAFGEGCFMDGSEEATNVIACDVEVKPRTMRRSR